MNSTNKIALILPAYNEALTIEAVIEDFYSVIPEANIVVIDNASTDNTFDLASNKLKQLRAKGKVLSYNIKGKGNAVRHAFRVIDADLYIMADADCTYLAKDLTMLMEPVIKEEYDMVVGNRLANNQYAKTKTRHFHMFGNRLVAQLINTLFKSKIEDILSGYRVFNRAFVKHFPLISDGFELETEITLHALSNKYRLLEIPISYQDRPSGSESKLNTFQDGFKVIRKIFSLFRLYNPLPFFSTLGLLAMALGLALGVPVVLEYMNTGLVPRFPTAILAAFIEIIGLALMACGLILDSFTQLNKRNMELWRLHHSSIMKEDQR